MKTFLVLASLGFVAPLTAQQQAIIKPTCPNPHIFVAAHSEIRLSPDRATIQISVQTRAVTAVAAANENASKQAAVIAALHSLGLRTDQISTINYNVYPEQRYEPNKEPVIVGYNVTNTVSVDVQKLSQVGPVIDAALVKGANMITSLQFYSSNTEDARRTAIAAAIQKARLDADAAARAAGGTVGELLEISIGAYSPPIPRPMLRIDTSIASSTQTPISPGDETLSVDVSTIWGFNTK